MLYQLSYWCIYARVRASALGGNRTPVSPFSEECSTIELLKHTFYKIAYYASISQIELSTGPLFILFPHYDLVYEETSEYEKEQMIRRYNAIRYERDDQAKYKSGYYEFLSPKYCHRDSIALSPVKVEYQYDNQ